MGKIILVKAAGCIANATTQRCTHAEVPSARAYKGGRKAGASL